MIHLRKNKVKLLLRLEAELERDDEGVCDAREDKSLGKRVCNLTTLHNVLFPNGLKRVDTRGVALANLHDLPTGLSLGLSIRCLR